MNLSKEEVSLLLGGWLKNYCLPRSVSHLKLFEDLRAGNILTTRLYKVLRDKKLTHLVVGEKIDITELFREAEIFFKKYEKIFIVGLNYWLTHKDLEVIRDRFEKKLY